MAYPLYSAVSPLLLLGISPTFETFILFCETAQER